MKIQVSPSILSADFGKLNEEIASIESYSDRIHFDVMDGHFVPNISFGAPVMRCVKTKLPLDVHLMIENPWKFFEDFVAAGADTIIVHSEACRNLKAVLKDIRRLGVKAGVSIKPKTGISVIKGVLDLVDHVLVMTVEPGFGGQDFMEGMLSKIAGLRGCGFKGDISVDGGINERTAKLCIGAGANIMIAGSYIFKAKDRKKAIMGLRG
jgi:ribulose-phosphate 3-epimerase